MSPALTRSRPLGLVAGVVVVAGTTLALYPLREVAPAVSLGVVYLLGVLAIATWWGLRAGLATSAASAMAFNVFHLAPPGS